MYGGAAGVAPCGYCITAHHEGCLERIGSGSRYWLCSCKCDKATKYREREGKRTGGSGSLIDVIADADETLTASITEGTVVTTDETSGLEQLEKPKKRRTSREVGAKP